MKKNKVKTKIIYLNPENDKRCQHFEIFYKGEEISNIVTYTTLEILTQFPEKLKGEFLKDFKKELGMEVKKCQSKLKKKKSEKQ